MLKRKMLGSQELYLVTVTDAAKEELKRILLNLNLGPNKCLRLAIPPTWNGQGDFGVVIDVAVDEDHVVELDGLKLLLVNPILAERLSDSTLDFKNPPDGAGLTLDIF